MNGLKELAERSRMRRERLEARANAELEACTFQPRVSHAPPPPPGAPEPIAAPPGYTQLFEKRHAAQSAKCKVRVAKSPLKVADATRAAQATQSSGSSSRNAKATGQQDSPLWGEAASKKLHGEAAKRLADSGSARVESSGKNRVSNAAAPSSPRTPTTSGADGGSAKVNDWHRFSNKAQVEFGDVVESIRRLNALLARPLPSPVRPAALYP
jgi:hypothetical protein